MREKIRWPFWLIVLILLLDLSIVIAVWAGLGNTPAALSLLITLVFTFFLYQFSALRIEAAGNQLKVGKACIELKYLGEIEVLDEHAMKFLRGPGINPSAYLAIRFWIKGGLKIHINDERDPTPYWLISTKKAEDLKRYIIDKSKS